MPFQPAIGVDEAEHEMAPDAGLLDEELAADPHTCAGGFGTSSDGAI